MRTRAYGLALTIGLAPMLLNATPAAAIALTDMLMFSGDASGNAIPGHGLDTLNGPHLNGSNLYDVFVSSDLTTPWSESCDPFSCPDAPSGVLANPLTSLSVDLQPGDNIFRFYANLPYPGYADPQLLKSYQIAFYFDGADYLSGAPAGIAAYVSEDGSFTAYAGSISNAAYGPFAPSSGLLSFQKVELADLSFQWDWLSQDTGVGQFNLRVTAVPEPATYRILGFEILILVLVVWARNEAIPRLLAGPRCRLSAAR